MSRDFQIVTSGAEKPDTEKKVNSNLSINYLEEIANLKQRFRFSNTVGYIFFII